MKIRIVTSLVIILTLITSQSVLALTFKASKFDIKKEIVVETFTKINIYGNVEVFITESNEQKVSIVGPEEVVEEVTYSNENGELKMIYGTKYDAKNRIQLHIQVKKIESITASGAVDVIGEGLFTIIDGKLEAKENSSIMMELEANTIEGILTGMGKISLAGKANNLNLKVADKAIVEAVNLFVEYASINTSSTENVYIDAFRKIDVTISNSGDVICKSKPMINSMNNTGKGKFQYN